MKGARLQEDVSHVIWEASSVLNTDGKSQAFNPSRGFNDSVAGTEDAS